MLVKMLLVAAALALATTTATAAASMERYQFLNPQLADGSAFIMFDSKTGRTWFLKGMSSHDLGWRPVPYLRVPTDPDRNDLPATPPK